MNSLEPSADAPRVTLHDQMKGYEKATRTFLPAHSYVVIRLDGKAFHSYTKGLDRPFDLQFMQDMDETARKLCEGISNAKFAYVQSDEISLILTDFTSKETQQWLGGAVQKMVSISAAMASVFMSSLRPNQEPAVFDARVFVLPDISAVEDYFVWRQRDARKNSVSMAAYTFFSHKEMSKVDTAGRIEALLGVGVNWNTYPEGFKNGRVIARGYFEDEVSYVRRDTGATHTEKVMRSRWVSNPAENFSSEDRIWNGPIIPLIPDSMK